MSELIINRPGFQTLLQDRGRKGAQRAGLTEGGAADQHAYRWANKLLDNHGNAACLEILMGQFEATVSDSAMIAVTGADLAFTINGEAADNWSTHWLQAGDTVAFIRPVSGLRAYLAVAGGWQTPVRFGSRSVVVREQLGGLDGGALKAKDRVPFGAHQATAQRQLAPQYIPDYQAELTLSVVPSYQYAEFPSIDRRRFTSGHYTVSNQIDRMGYRLKGPVIVPKISGVISEGIAMGAVQVPQDGQPIVLLRDRQTIGGYPKIGCVSSLCCSKLSQRGPGAWVSFEFAELADVQAKRVLFDRFFDASHWTAAGKTVAWP